MAARGAPTASELFRHLNGLISVHKPAGYRVRHCMDIVRHKLACDLNSVADRQQTLVSGAAQLTAALRALAAPAHLSELVQAGCVTPAEGGGSDCDRAAVRSVGGELAAWLPAPLPHQIPSRLVTGPAFLPQDVRIEALYSLGRLVSGPLVLGVNRGTTLTRGIRTFGPQLRVYHMTVKLGVATDNLWGSGKVTDRATFGHVTRGKLEALLSTLQAAHQRHMFESSGLPINSQAAYELAARGPPRPDSNSPPVLYALRVVQFAPPFFTLEVHCINETEQYLLTLANDLGRQLRSAATAVSLRCLRVGPFTAEDALLMKNWRLHQLGPNMAAVRRAAQRLAVSGTLEPAAAGGARTPQPFQRTAARSVSVDPTAQQGCIDGGSAIMQGRMPAAGVEPNR